MITWILLVASIFWAGDLEICTASTFGQRGDRLAGGVAPYLGRRVRPSDEGIAHRTWPLGSWVRVCVPRTGRCETVKVIDRGPFGAVNKRGKWRNAARDYRRWYRSEADIPRWAWTDRRGVEWHWRGCADLTPRLRRKLKHNGFEQVVLWRLP